MNTLNSIRTSIIATALLLGMSPVASAEWGGGLFEGPQGPQGEQGPQGDRGPQGIRGIRGLRGHNGTTGAPGETGAQGIAGLDGSNGSNGSNGEDGSNGADGTNGTNGSDGSNGTNGTNGTNGSDAYVDRSDYQGVGAMAMAGANIHFNPDSDKWQAGIGVGQYEGVTGGAVSFGKKLGIVPGKPLLSVSGTTNSHRGRGVGAGLTFGF